LSSSSIQSLSEKELLLLYQKDHDKKWLGVVLERYTVVLVGVCMKYLKNQEEVKDVVQQVFIKALRHLETKTIDNVGGWLYQVAKNECLDILRKQTFDTDIETAAYNLSNETTDIELLIQKEVTLEALHKAIRELKEEQRICIELFFIQQKSYQEIVAITSFDLKQVKSCIQNGKRNLKIKLEEQHLGKE
jgi:RNA polymerase sigma factor (sigma-70 family)